ncbi:MAG: hypothetical protein QNJ41_09710 [Xenococcaceae cyanobacterium MO_188.B32]|nr:hypothetical protein [Xenococcaceae cyanobacterium MO_188.B32]
MLINYLQDSSFVRTNIYNRQIVASVKAVPDRPEQKIFTPKLWVISTTSLLIIIVGLSIYSKWKFNKMLKTIQYEQFKVKNLHKRLKLALETIHQWEANPDLVHSRDFNLDYLRMRMEEKHFHNTILNQVKIKVKQFISTALRICSSQDKLMGIANQNGCTVDEIFDITYETKIEKKVTRRVLFRIQIKLQKLPSQSTSETIAQIIKCLETFLSPEGIDENWQPAIQGYLVSISWNQQCKPTPLLLLEQNNEGMNVSFSHKQNIKK